MIYCNNNIQLIFGSLRHPQTQVYLNVRLGNKYIVKVENVIRLWKNELYNGKL